MLCMILTDVIKAFDVITHKILLDKLHPISFAKDTVNRHETD